MKVYKYKDMFTIKRDNKGINVIFLNPNLIDRIDGFMVDEKMVGLVVDGDKLFEEFVSALVTARDEFQPKVQLLKT